MTSTTLNGFGLEPQWDFSTFRCQLPEKLAVCPAQTPNATERNVGTNHERVLMAGSSCVHVPAIEYSPRHRTGSAPPYSAPYLNLLWAAVMRTPPMSRFPISTRNRLPWKSCCTSPMIYWNDAPCRLSPSRT